MRFVTIIRKPLSGTVATTVLEHGTGGVNVEPCRVAGVKPVMVRTATIVAPNAMAGASTGATSTGETTTEGRWPSNVILHGTAQALDSQIGFSQSRGNVNAERTGGASRFFKVIA